MKMGTRAVLIATVAGSTIAAMGQLTGVSHPEEVPVTTSPEGIAQPVVYEAPASVVIVPASAPALRERTVTQNAPVMQASAAEPTRQPGTAAQTLREQDAPASRGSSTAYDPDANLVSIAPGPANQLPVGAMLRVRLHQEISTGSTAAGTPFTAELIDPMEREGHVLLPAGSLVHGKVTEVHAGKRINGAASIHLEMTAITLPDGTRYGLRGQVVDTDRYRSSKVDEEGTIERKDHVKGTIATLGLATGSGMAAGAVFGGWPGALVGGVVGAGIGTAVWLRQSHQTELPAGSEITFSLTEPLTVGGQ